MVQKKAKPVAGKGKSGSDKVPPKSTKAQVKAAASTTMKVVGSTKATAGKAPASNKVQAKTATKPSVVKQVASKPAAPKSAPQSVQAKTVQVPAPKKPLATAKLAVVAKPIAGTPKAVAPKVEMPPSIKKPDAGKVAAAKPVAPGAKPAATAPVVAVKPVVQAKPAEVVRPAMVAAGVKPAAAVPVTSAVRAGPNASVGGKAPIAAPVAATAPSEPKKSVSARHGFKTGEWIVYPAQGVGRIVAIEEQEIAGMKLELFVITFEKDKMTLRVPTGKAQTHGMRKLAEDNIVNRAMETLKGRARIKRTMWSRRAQEFEAKINSGDLVSVAEVVRDLYRAESQPEQSYSERLLFERALDRMAREIAAVDKTDERGAAQRITEVLSKSAKARRPVGEAEPAAAESDEGEGDEATAAA